MRVCLDVKVQPVFIPFRVQYPAACGGRRGSGLAPRVIPFIPKGEPWRNGVIENLNGLIQRLLLKAKVFKNEKQLFKEVQKLETCINATHQLPALNGKTPNQFSKKAALRFLSSGYNWRK